jgi:hypothetical protein
MEKFIHMYILMNTKGIVIIVLVVLVFCGIIGFQFFKTYNNTSVKQDVGSSLSNSSTSQNTGSSETSITTSQPNLNVSDITGTKDINVIGDSSGNIIVSGESLVINPLEKDVTHNFNNKQITLV